MAELPPANTPAIKTDADHSRDFPFSKLPPELQIKVFEHSLLGTKSNSSSEKPTKPDILCLSRNIFQKLGPKYYQSRIFHFKRPREFIDAFLQTATKVCLHNTAAIRVRTAWAFWSMDEDEDQIGDMEMFVNILMMAMLPLLHSIELTVGEIEHHERKVNNLFERGDFDGKSEEVKQWWDKMHLRRWVGNGPAKCKSRLQAAFPSFIVDYFIVLKFIWDDAEQIVEMREHGQVPSAPKCFCLKRVVMALTRK